MKEALVEPWIDTVMLYFMARPSLGGLVYNSEITGDSGPKRMVWPGTPSAPTGVYWGVEFQLNVTSIVERSYNSNE